MKKVVTFILVSLTLGCGGGSAPVSETPTNSSPQITSAATFSVMEGETNIGSVTALDLDNDTLSYSVSGTDASAVIITSSGMLSFISAPDYQTKASYSITVTVSDGTASTTQTITIIITSNSELDGNYTNNPNLSGQFLDAVLVNRNPDCRAYVADANAGNYSSTQISDLSNGTSDGISQVQIDMVIASNWNVAVYNYDDVTVVSADANVATHCRIISNMIPNHIFYYFEYRKYIIPIQTL